MNSLLSMVELEGGFVSPPLPWEAAWQSERSPLLALEEMRGGVGAGAQIRPGEAGPEVGVEKDRRIFLFFRGWPQSDTPSSVVIVAVMDAVAARAGWAPWFPGPQGGPGALTSDSRSG